MPEALELSDFSERLRQLETARRDAALADKGALAMYFDTHDVRRAILGAREYIRIDRGAAPYVDKREFDRSDALTGCLMGGGFLGQFSMLAPHQHELLRQMQTAEAFSRTGNAKLTKEQFLQQVGITEPWGSDASQVQDRQALRRILNRYAGQRTERFYKAIQCVRHPWWRQLSRLRATKTLVATSETFEYPKLLSGRLLPKIVEAFDKIRGTVQHNHLVSQNNFADAMCMMMLIELVARHNSRASSTVPRFFDGTKTFREAAKLAGVERRLEVRSDSGRSSALVSFDYLMFRASLMAQKIGQHDALEQLSSDLNDKLDRRSDLGQLETIMHRQGVRSLNLRFEQLLNYSFLENVWLRTIAEEELQALAGDWATDLTSSAQFREVIESTISEVSSDVLKGADEYKRFSTTWLTLRSDLIRWRSSSREDHSGLMTAVESHSYGLALFRISPAEHVLPIARRMLEELSDDAHDEQTVFATTAWTTLFSALVSAGRARAADDRTAQDDLEAAVAVLWCVGSYRKAVDLFNELAPQRRSYRVRTACVAAMLKLGREPRAVEDLINELARDTHHGEVADLTDLEIREVAEQASSLGYLWFHLWQLRWKLGAWWRCREEDMPRVEHPHYDRLLRNAIDAVNAAWTYIQGRPEAFERSTDREVYVANQCLYYLVELGNEDDLEWMDSMHQRLAGYKDGHEEYWRQTYSDTLSRYYAFRAARTDSREHWAKYMGFAQRHFGDAQGAARSESPVQQFGEYLTKRFEKGFRGRAVRPGNAMAFRNSR